jgi:puromycin-sensitive aminopeptidase
VIAPTSPYRLPRTTIPTRYEITLRPDLENASFKGSVVIEADIVEAGSEIWLNAAELDISSATVHPVGGEEIQATVALHEDTERAQLTLAKAVRPGKHTIHLDFTGILNDKLRGFYRSKFTDTQGKERLIATTQFESTDARRAFPCFDEPEFKAVYGVTLVVPQDLFAVSNGPMVSEKPNGDGTKSVVFGDTMKMSTYLVAFIVGPFEATPPVNVDGVPLRIVHPIGKGHLTGYALKAGAHALKFFTSYYGIRYPGQKLDMIAVPDFAFGAMENLGCITYREVLLLVDEKRSTQPELMRIADVIAHEIAHMWFGDLVTMRWWNGIWLNEAFATFMATAATDAFNPGWHRWVQFSLDRSAAFDVDSLDKTRPIEVEVNSPQDADAMFDLLTYEKGGSVLRMLEQYLGEERYRDGIRHYLDKHQYANTETSDLWDAIEHVTGEPARSVMDSWIFQRGYPLVSVELSGDTTLKISQQRFRYTPVPGGDATLWQVPVVLRYSAAGEEYEERLLLHERSREVKLNGRPDWLIANAGGNGFYRVRYSPDLLQALTPRMMDALQPIERYGLVDDTWAAVQSGATPATAFLEFARGFENETDLDVWTVLSGALGAMDRLLDGEARKVFQGILGRLYGAALARLGWEPKQGESSRDLELRGALIRALAASAKDADALKRARALHARYLEDPDAVEPNVAAAAASAVASDGSSSDYQVFTQRFKSASTPQEERRYQSLLGAFPGGAEMENTLKMTLNGEVRTQDAPYLLVYCLMNREQGPKAWKFISESWDEIVKKFPDNSIVRMAGGVRSLSKPELAAEVEKFFETHKVPTGELTMQQHLEKLRVNVALREREAARLAASLTK